MSTIIRVDALAGGIDNSGTGANTLLTSGGPTVLKSVALNGTANNPGAPTLTAGQVIPISFYKRSSTTGAITAREDMQITAFTSGAGSSTGGTLTRALNGTSQQQWVEGTDLWMHGLGAEELNNVVTAADTYADSAAQTAVVNAGPGINGYNAWTYDPALYSAGGVQTKGDIFYLKFYVGQAFTAAHVDIDITSAANVGSSSPTYYVGFYSAAGAQLAVSGNLQGTIDTGSHNITGIVALPISYAFPSPGYYWIGLLCGNTVTTAPSVAGIESLSSGMVNANVTNGSGTLGARASLGATAQTVLPSPISGTPSAINGLLWCGVRST